MKFKFNHSQFIFFNESGDRFVVTFTPLKKPKPFEKYQVTIWRENRQIKSFIVQCFANKTNAKGILERNIQ